MARPEKRLISGLDDDHSVVALQFEPLHPSPEASHRRNQVASTSPREVTNNSHSGDVDTGFLQVYGHENQLDAEQQELEATLEPKNNLSEPLQHELMQTFAETYWENCYTWCPVLDRDRLDEEMSSSALLANAVALAASHICPPLVPHEGPASYYSKAKTIFYNDEEPDTLTALKALSLFYWWAPRSPSTAHRNSSWWWTSLIIRIGQQMNIHREPPEGDPLRDRLSLGLRRRIWWTVFVSRPCIAVLDFCAVLTRRFDLGSRTSYSIVSK
jgi:Fungal specific transcription factor domain